MPFHVRIRQCHIGAIEVWACNRLLDAILGLLEQVLNEIQGTVWGPQSIPAETSTATVVATLKRIQVYLREKWHPTLRKWIGTLSCGAFSYEFFRAMAQRTQNARGDGKFKRPGDRLDHDSTAWWYEKSICFVYILVVLSSMRLKTVRASFYRPWC